MTPSVVGVIFRNENFLNVRLTPPRLKMFFSFFFHPPMYYIPSFEMWRHLYDFLTGKIAARRVPAPFVRIRHRAI